MALQKQLEAKALTFNVLSDVEKLRATLRSINKSLGNLAGAIGLPRETFASCWRSPPEGRPGADTIGAALRPLRTTWPHC